MLSNKIVDSIISELILTGACAAALIDKHGFVLGTDGDLAPDILGGLGSLISHSVEQVVNRLDTIIYDFKMRTSMGLLIGRPTGDLVLISLVDREESVEAIEQVIENGVIRIKQHLTGNDPPLIMDIPARERMLFTFLNELEALISFQLSGFALERILNKVEDKLIELGLVNKHSSYLREIYLIVRSLRLYMNSPPPRKVIIEILSVIDSWKKSLSTSNT